MSDSATLKIDRAAKHVLEINELLREKRPFAFIVQTDTRTNKHTAFVKEDTAIVNEVALISGDVAHNLRAALDHAYWDIVSPHATSPRDERNIQFPFCETAARLDEAIRNRLADRISPRFFQALIDLKPHGDTGGNDLLYLIHQLDALDKHRLLIPTCDETRFPYGEAQRLIPGFPVQSGRGAAFTQCVFSWKISVPPSDFGAAKPPTTHIFEKEIHIPIEVVISVTPLNRSRPLVPTLNQLVDVAREIVKIIRKAAA